MRALLILANAAHPASRTNLTCVSAITKGGRGQSVTSCTQGVRLTPLSPTLASGEVGLLL